MLIFLLSLLRMLYVTLQVEVGRASFPASVTKPHNCSPTALHSLAFFPIDKIPSNLAKPSLYDLREYIPTCASHLFRGKLCLIFHLLHNIHYHRMQSIFRERQHYQGICQKEIWLILQYARKSLLEENVSLSTSLQGF